LEQHLKCFFSTELPQKPILQRNNGISGKVSGQNFTTKRYNHLYNQVSSV
jgi:hypothetical protein